MLEAKTPLAKDRQGCSERMRDRRTGVQILNNLFQPYTGNLSRAMGRASERQSLLTENLANVNTPGYKRRDISLDITIEREGEPFEIFLDRQSLRSGRTDMLSSGSLRSDGNNVDLERESMAIAETEIRYQMLGEFANRYFSGLKNVIREGR
ncbi:MAG TPA: flagellar basal body rod protein FlgB [Fimbriimonadaceae bacterium]|nr:flagellar basal body rod protein FlgB [Fimbriimonadaceae bacterium]HRJ33454.1 flagellar basal body rod protein FlgB [Fimbriimonadaceae bacterium]